MAEAFLLCAVLSFSASARASASDVELAMKNAVVGGRLRVEYALVNRSTEPVFIFDRMWDRRAKRLGRAHGESSGPVRA